MRGPGVQPGHKLPCPCGSGATAGQCCRSPGRQRGNIRKAEAVKSVQQRGHCIARVYLEHAFIGDLARLARYIGTPVDVDAIDRKINEGSSRMRTAHIVTHRKR